MIERIEFNGSMLAVVVRSTFESVGTNYLSADDNSLQLGIINRKKGETTRPHIHKISPKTIMDVQEAMHIECGIMEVEFYNDAGEKFTDIQLTAGDTILLISGGHGFNYISDCKIVEIKQGPYMGFNQDKQQFE